MKSYGRWLAMMLALFLCLTACAQEEASAPRETILQETEELEEPEVVYSQGLEFQLNSDGASWVLSGMGTCTDTLIRVPPQVEGKPVTEVRDGAFTDIHEPELAFVLPDSIVTIQATAFMRSSGVKQVELGNAVSFIGAHAFYGTGIASIRLPETMTEIRNQVFGNCLSLKEVVVPQGVTALHPEAFLGSGVESVTLPSSLTEIGHSAFENCQSLRSIVIPENVTVLAYDAFRGCASLESAQVLGPIERLESYLFYDCDLVSITLPGTVNAIDWHILSGSERLQDIYFGGTTGQWTAASKAAIWDENTPEYTIHCTDGDTPKTGPLLDPWVPNHF